MSKNHFVLVHGLGQGAWCWYRVKTLLESAGHQVTALDLAASGTNLKKLSDVHTFLDYSEPLLKLMETIPSEEKVVLVGHSLGGLNIAYAMERFPEKVSVAVFLTAFMPDTTHRPSYVLEKFCELVPMEAFLDTQYSVEEGPVNKKVTMYLGPKDFTLGFLLSRVGSMFLEDLSTAAYFSDAGYGSVNRAYIVAEEDHAVTKEFQRWMITNIPVREEMMIEGSDHMAMFSKPQKVCNLLIEVSSKFH